MAIEHVFILDEALDHPVTKRVLHRLPGVSQTVVDSRSFHQKIGKAIREERSLAGFPKEAVEFVRQVGASPTGALDMGETCAFSKRYLFLTTSERDTILKLSERGNQGGTPINCCEYWQLNPISSCPYQCLYCFETVLRRKLQPFMRMYVNYDAVREALASLDASTKCASVNMGEHADSLAQEDVFAILPEVIGWFAGFKRLKLLLLSKGGDIKRLPEAPQNRSVGIAFSVNTPAAAAALEIDAPTPEERLQMMRAARERGYRVALRIDPLVPWPADWRQELVRLVDLIHEYAPQDLKECTIGSMRFRSLQSPLFLQMHQGKVPCPSGASFRRANVDDVIASIYDKKVKKDTGFADGYARFPADVRRELYTHLVDLLRKRRPQLRLTLCQETETMYGAVEGVRHPGSCNCIVSTWA